MRFIVNQSPSLITKHQMDVNMEVNNNNDNNDDDKYQSED